MIDLERKKEGKVEAFLVGAAGVVLFLVYGYLFFRNIGPYWFNPRWTTDDALQQLFPFHAVWNPDIFQNDLIYIAMKGYLAPIHYLLGYLITLGTKDPLMTGHWMMLIQLVLTLVPLALAVWTFCAADTNEKMWPKRWEARHWAALAPALMAMTWFLHARPLVQRLTAGLPRGWAPPIFALYFLFAIRGNHRAILVLLGCAALLNPPAAFLAGFSYGGYVLYIAFCKKRVARSFKPFVELLVVTPFIAAATLFVTHRPPEIGKLATLTEAEKMPEFSKSGGRFTFLPFPPPLVELRDYSFRSVVSKIYNPGPFWHVASRALIALFVVVLLLASFFLKREIIPTALVIFLICDLITYFLSRPLAFRLYVPDRHLTFPMGMFLIAACTAGTYQLFKSGSLPRHWLRAGLGLVIVCFVIYKGSGLGLQSTDTGTANFNYHEKTRGGAAKWARKSTARDALFAGNPIHLDPIPLYGMRRAFVTHETWHPFYLAYNKEIKKRLDVCLRAHYSRDFNEFLALIEPHRIDYFIFERAMFKEHRLRKAHFNKPFTQMVTDLTSYAPNEYLISKLPVGDRGVVPYFDTQSIVVDVKKLRAWVGSQEKVQPS